MLGRFVEIFSVAELALNLAVISVTCRRALPSAWHYKPPRDYLTANEPEPVLQGSRASIFMIAGNLPGCTQVLIEGIAAYLITPMKRLMPIARSAAKTSSTTTSTCTVEAAATVGSNTHWM